VVTAICTRRYTKYGERDRYLGLGLRVEWTTVGEVASIS